MSVGVAAAVDLQTGEAVVIKVDRELLACPHNPHPPTHTSALASPPSASLRALHSVHAKRRCRWCAQRMNPAVDRFQAERLLRELMIHRRLTRLGERSDPPAPASTCTPACIDWPGAGGEHTFHRLAGAAVVHLRGVLIPASDTSAFVVMERMDADLRQVSA